MFFYFLAQLKNVGQLFLCLSDHPGSLNNTQRKKSSWPAFILGHAHQ